MRRKSLGKGIHALIRSNIHDDEKDQDEDREAETTQSNEGQEQLPEQRDTEEKGVTENLVASGSPKIQDSGPEPRPQDFSQLISEEVLQQLKELKEMDFSEKRIATYQKALERAWFDEKITADEQFILDGLREILEITDDEHKNIETEILHTLEERYSEGIDKKIPLGKIENEHDRRKREIYEYFQRGSEFYEADKYFDAIVEWEKILELDPANPIIMKAINNARRQIDSPDIEAIGTEPVFSYSNPLKDVKMSDKDAEKVEKEPVKEPPKSEIERENAEWLSKQKEIQSELMTIKEETEAEKKKVEKLFKMGYKNYKAGKFLRAIKIWKKLLTIDPEHIKSKKGIKFAKKKYRAKKKAMKAKKLELEKKKKKKAAEKLAKISEMEIPEIEEIMESEKAEVVSAKEVEMEIAEIEAEVEAPAKAEEPPAVTAEIAETKEAEAKSETQPEIIDGELAVEEKTPTPVIQAEVATKKEVKEVAIPPEDTKVELTEKEPIPTELPVKEEVTVEDISETKVEEKDEYELETEPEIEPKIGAESEPKIEKEAPKPPEELSKEYYEKAINMAKAGRFRDSMQLLDEVLDVDPNNSEAWNDKGILLWSTKQYKEALNCYDKAVKIKPDFIDAWVNKGVVLNNLERQNEALSAYEKALSLDDSMEEIWTNKGVVLFKLHKLSEAAESFNKGIQLNPDSEEAWLNLGSTYEKMGRYSDAVSAFEKVLVINSHNQDAIAGLEECNKNLKYELLRHWNI